jgi:hypothetical protein
MKNDSMSVFMESAGGSTQTMANTIAIGNLATNLVLSASL